MKAIGKGILVVLITIGLWAVACNVKAGTQDELRELLDNKIIVYNGVCWFDKKNILTFKTEDKVTVKRCVVGMELPDQTKHYVLLTGKGGATELLVYDETTKTQKSLWRTGTEV